MFQGLIFCMTCCFLKTNILIIFYSSFCLQVDGNFLDRALNSKQRNGYTSVLFYASWCPFSCSLHPKFDVLSSMFPQLEHLAVEESSASPRCVATYPAFSVSVCAQIIEWLFLVLVICFWLQRLSNLNEGYSWINAIRRKNFNC